MLLATTALPETWQPKQETLFLGEWCRRYDLRDIWQGIPHEVAPYHWDNREKLYQDSLMLEKLFEELLPEVSNQLNSIHGTTFSLRYWRVLVGPWLAYFTQVLFDRWSMIRAADESGRVSRTICLELPRDFAIPQNVEQFLSFAGSDIWNHQIWTHLIKACTTIEVCGASKAATILTPHGGGARPAKGIARKYGALLSNSLFGIAAKDTEPFLIGTGLRVQDSLRLQASLHQIPKLWRPVPPPISNPNFRKRTWALGEGISSTPFATVLRSLIPTHIPTVYLEGYSALRQTVARVPWPRRPKFIWTSGSWNSDEVFKAWAAEKAEAEVPLFIGQHGGTYGMARYFFNEGHELAIASAYLSWGWTNPAKAVRPVGNWRTTQKVNRRNECGYALMVEVSLPRYSYHLHSIPVAGQWLKYYSEQCEFVSALSPSLQGQLRVRLYAQDYGWRQRDRWADRFPNLVLDEGKASLHKMMRDARVVISTYNATTFLESMALNIPTVIFWNPEYWELRVEVKRDFESLSRVGIFHGTPQSAARHLSSVWNDVDAWWFSPSVQQAREAFCNIYSYCPPDMLSRLRQTVGET